MVKRLFLGNWVELIAMTTKYPWVVGYKTQINLLVKILQHGTGALCLLTARSCIMFPSSNFPSFVLITALFFLQSWQLQVYPGERAFLFCDKLL